MVCPLPYDSPHSEYSWNYILPLCRCAKRSAVTTALISSDSSTAHSEYSLTLTCVGVFFIPLAIFALPSRSLLLRNRNSDAGSHTRLFSLHHGTCLGWLSRERLNPFLPRGLTSNRVQSCESPGLHDRNRIGRCRLPWRADLRLNSVANERREPQQPCPAEGGPP